MEQTFVEKFYHRIKKIDPKAFEDFIKVVKILNWKNEFEFNKSFENGNTCSSPYYWWSHKYTKNKSGEKFENEEEMELSALIYYCNIKHENKVI